MRRDYRVIRDLTWTWLVLWIIQSQVSSVSSMMFFTANVELHYLRPGTNQTMISVCDCGIYEPESLLKQAFGYVGLPDSDPLACQPNSTFTIKQKPWIALIKRGNCTQAEKIQAAEREGASAVVIYSLDGTGNGTNSTSPAGTDNIVVIMIGNLLGRRITALIESGTDVYMKITVASQHAPWNAFWVYIMSFVFFGITAIILGYFVFVVISRFYQNRQLRIQQEVDAEESSCVVCLDSFMRCDVVTTLPCSHFFHKTCIEPWLLEHHTCPMCKYDILIGEESFVPPEDVRFYPSTVSGLVVNSRGVVTSPQQQGEARLSVNTQTTECAEEQNSSRMDHIYMNPAFEEEQRISDHQDPDCQSHQV